LSSQSEYAGTVGATNFATGTAANWTSQANAEGAPSGSFATIASMLHGSTSNSLEGYDFGFSVSGTINGLMGGVTAKMSITGSVEFLQTYVELGSTAGAFTANLLATTLLTITATAYSVGGSTDTCGLTTPLTAANINTNTENAGPTFGFTIKNTSGSSSNGVSAEGIELTAYYTASSPPATPTGLAVVNDATNPTSVLDVSWNASTGATSYNLLQSSTLGGTFSAVQTGISGTSTTVTGLTPGTEYAFEIEAVGTGGTSSASSAVAWATAAAAPTSLSAAVLTTIYATVSFTGASTGSNVGVYQYVYRYETPVGAANWTSSGGGSASPVTVGAFSPNTQYGIEVATVIESTNGDWAGTIQGPWSAELTITTPPYQLPARCNVVMARKIYGWTIKTF
jgi:hypothetical protein